MAIWPSTLPRPRAQGYQLAPVDQTVRTDMETGAARVRRRTAARNDRVTLEWVFNPVQMASFRTWFDADCAGGAAWFTGLAAALGDGLAAELRFTQAWTAEAVGAEFWRVQAELEAR